MTTQANRFEQVYGRRRRAVLRNASRGQARLLLVSQPQDVGYLTGFTGDDSYLLLGPGIACLITDGRYDEQARAECGGLEIFVRKGPLPAAIRQVLAEHKAPPRSSLGVQAEHMTLRGCDGLAAELAGRKIKPVSTVTGDLRSVKDEIEIAAIRRAVRVAEQAFERLFDQGRAFFVGRTERQIAAELDYRMRLGGADQPSFETIVAAGVNASKPHYRPGEAKIASNMAVLIDWGAMVGGYCSDLTRVVFTGRIPANLGEVYEIVLKAQSAGISAVRAGRFAKAVDAAAREVITRFGFGDRFVHGLGHGIGRQIHEGPALAAKAGGRLRSGMVVTVEPGIYLPGVGGVRIEDDVLVGPAGSRRLSSLAREIDKMVLR